MLIKTLLLAVLEVTIKFISTRWVIGEIPLSEHISEKMMPFINYNLDQYMKHISHCGW
jgi:hypothetical protein